MSKKIIYIVGCGRSGSTLMGFALGNVTGALDLGEVMDFLRFRGHPNGFDHESNNYQFWDGVLQNVVSSQQADLDELEKIQMNVGSHSSFLPLLVFGGLYRRKSVAAYREYLKSLYDSIQKRVEAGVVIDSSKYPTHLLHLLRIYPDTRVCVIHLVRDPIKLAGAFKQGVQSKPKSFLQSMLYYFVINAFAVLLTRGLGKDRYQRVFYEDFVSTPESVLQRVGMAFNWDTQNAISKITNNEPLERGFVFNGNRMRLDQHVIFRKQAVRTTPKSLPEKIFSRLSTLCFGRSSQSSPA